MTWEQFIEKVDEYEQEVSERGYEKPEDYTIIGFVRWIRDVEDGLYPDDDPMSRDEYGVY